MKWEQGAQFENPPVGSHIARCYSVVDLGTQSRKAFQGEGLEHSRQVRLSFELPTELMEGVYNAEYKGKPFSVHLNVKASLHPKANLRKFLEGWRGRKFTPEEAEGFDPKKLVGLPCRVTLTQSESGEYINITGLSPLGKKEKCPKQINKGVFFSLQENEFDKKVYDALGERTREKIAKSPEFKQIAGGAPGEEAQEDAPSDAGGGHAPEPQPAEDPDCPF